MRPPIGATRYVTVSPALGGLAALVLVAVVAVGLVAYADPGADCARTPLDISPDVKGTSLHEIRQSLANEYATRVRYVQPEPDGADAVEMSVWDAGGDFFHGNVSVIRASSGDGWLQATANTCGD
jgi:hypothetical protein